VSYSHPDLKDDETMIPLERIVVAQGKVVAVARKIVRDSMPLSGRKDKADHAWLVTDQVWNELRVAVAEFDETK
jgi:hypothetical protein